MAIAGSRISARRGRVIRLARTSALGLLCAATAAVEPRFSEPVVLPAVPLALAGHPELGLADHVTVDVGAEGCFPARIELPRHSSVVWINSDRRPHRVESAGANFRSQLLSPGETLVANFPDAGLFAYRCPPGLAASAIVIRS